jgi:hypothetical protein
LPGAAADSWEVEYEFLDLATQASVRANTVRVDWAGPQIRLFPRTLAGGTAAGVVSAFTERPAATPFAVGVPHRIRVNYTCATARVGGVLRKPNGGTARGWCAWRWRSSGFGEVALRKGAWAPITFCSPPPRARPHLSLRARRKAGS